MNDIKLTSFKVFFESYKLKLDEAPLHRTGRPYEDMLRAFTSPNVDGKEADDMLANVDDATMLNWMKSKFISRNVPVISRDKMTSMLGELRKLSNSKMRRGRDDHSRTSY